MEKIYAVILSQHKVIAGPVFKEHDEYIFVFSGVPVLDLLDDHCEVHFYHDESKPAF